MQEIRGIVFDLGNTLAPFGADQHRQLRARLAEELGRHLDGIPSIRLLAAVDEADRELTRLRDQTLSESDPTDWIRRTVTALGREPSRPILDTALGCLHETFVALLRVGEEATAVLRRLADRYRLGLLSNYWMKAPVLEVLERDGLSAHLMAVLVSAEIGVVKPHPRLFEEISQRLGLRPEQILFVGDNPRADIEGAATVGMATALTTEYLEGADERDRPAPAGPEPDYRIGHIGELEILLARR